MPHSSSTPPIPERPEQPERIPHQVRRGLAGTFADAASFRERIDRRSAELAQVESARAQRLERAPQRLKAAAGLMPPGLLSGGLIAGGKNLGAKGAAGLLAVPVISFAMVLITLGAGLRTLWQLRQPGATLSPAAKDAASMTADWWERNRRAAVVSLLVVVALASIGHSETALLCVLLSSYAVVMLIGELAGAGVADSAKVGRWTAGVLYYLGLYGFMLSVTLPASTGGGNAFSAVAILMLGAPMCLMASGQLSWRRVLDAFDAPVQRMQHRDLPSVVCLRALMSLVAVGVAIGLALVVGAAGLAFVSGAPSRDRLVDFARTFEAPVDGATAWNEFEQVLVLLHADGGDLGDLTPAGRVSAQVLESENDILQPAARAAARFGLVGSDVLARWSTSGSANYLRRTNTPPLDPIASGAALWTLLASGALDEADRVRIADKLEASWPASDAPRALMQMRGCVEWFEALGQDARVAAHRADIQDAVSRAWPATSQRWYPAPAFQWDADHTRKGVELLGGEGFRSSMWEPTNDALVLLERCGMPPDLELEPLRDAISSALLWSRALALMGGVTTDDPGLELVAVRLERLLPSNAHGGLLGALIARRLLLAVLGLVIVCVVASARGRRSKESL